MVSPIEYVKRQSTLLNHRISALPVLVLAPHSHCDCRCIMCDIWRSDQESVEISRLELGRHLEDIKKLRVRRVVLTGGEPLLHSNLWAFCEELKKARVRITLHTSGQKLSEHAASVAAWCDEVILSLDGGRKVHNIVRNVPDAFEQLTLGVTALRAVGKKMTLGVRCVLQRRNYFDVGNVIDEARGLGAQWVSFVPADVWTSSFGRTQPWEGAKNVILTPEETKHFGLVVENLIRTRKKDLGSFVRETPEDFRSMLRYFRALNEEDSFPPHECNAPWTSAVLEADGSLRPCLFHEPFGNVSENSLESVLNSPEAIAFREQLDVESNHICRRCVYASSMPPHRRA